MLPVLLEIAFMWQNLPFLSVGNVDLERLSEGRLDHGNYGDKSQGYKGFLNVCFWSANANMRHNVRDSSKFGMLVGSPKGLLVLK